MKEIRPTSNKVMLALFNILGDKVRDSKFLDLFAGTGTIGLESLKRGAESCVFVESVRARADSIKQKTDSLVLSLEIRRALSWLTKRGMKFDIIFADPPYNSDWCGTLPTLSNLTKIFMPDSIFIIEHSIREKLTFSENPYNLQIISTREYGETALTFMNLL
ncbi:MAG: RsmD family RNA methyltransferase [Synergistaceae bacterium]|nr:RsmD family RNA methyltransferase [Synergistaceae bacterium]